jgi:hypothetical protein
VSPQEVTVGLSFLTVISAGINAYVGLRLAALQAKLRADASTLEVSLLKQFVTWKDDVLSAINGKYVSEKLVVEIRTSMGRELGMLSARMDHIEKRCECRPKDCLALRCQQHGGE